MAVIACFCSVSGASVLWAAESPAGQQSQTPESYTWTTDHMQVGVRWQPFAGRPMNNAYDATRPVISEDSSYAQFWVAWSSSEPTEAHTDYANRMSTYLKTIEQAVDACVAEGLKVELVFWHCPAWASVSGLSGGVRPKDGYRAAFVRRVATHFKGRVHAYQLAHEANLRAFLDDGISISCWMSFSSNVPAPFVRCTRRLLPNRWWSPRQAAPPVIAARPCLAWSIRGRRRSMNSTSDWPIRTS